MKTFTFWVIFLLFFAKNSLACSSYKVTVGDKTMAGSNFDAYYLDCQLWFENAQNMNEHGAFFTGGRRDGKNGIAPQTGMNEAGLTFSRLSSAPPEKEILPQKHKKSISNPTLYLKEILHRCKTVEEVKNYISQYDYGYFQEDVFFYIDKAGKYLVVEPDTLIMGGEAKYVLGNFCPSQITDFSSIKQGKYQKGVTFLRNKIDTSLTFCTALSDTMHVCRPKIGDGTLLTIIRDVKEGLFYLNFYHDFTHQVKFNLQEELAKGDHAYTIPSLFPPNSEYQRLINYKIPQNNDFLRFFMLFCGGIFFFSSIFFGISFFRKEKTSLTAKLKAILAIFNLFLLYYIFLLLRIDLIFYFPTPYQDERFPLLTLASYLPRFMLLCFVPGIYVNRMIFKEKAWTFSEKWLFTFNNLLYFCLILLFIYWRLIL
ncbi:MAG: hypothetical protein ACKVTZ_18325 [Bacteroidia bacterium]